MAYKHVNSKGKRHIPAEKTSKEKKSILQKFLEWLLSKLESQKEHRVDTIGPQAPHK